MSRTCIGNRTLHASAFPTLKQLIIDSSRLVPNPNNEEKLRGQKTVYDSWAAHSPDNGDPTKPM